MLRRSAYLVLDLSAFGAEVAMMRAEVAMMGAEVAIMGAEAPYPLGLSGYMGPAAWLRGSGGAQGPEP